MRVYIKGDIGGQFEVYSAHTDALLSSVTGIDVSRIQGAFPEGRLFYSNGTEEVVDIVSAPTGPTCAFTVSATRERHFMGAADLIEATLRRPGQQDCRARRTVSDQEVQASSFDAIKEATAELIRTVLEPLVKELSAEEIPATGGPIGPLGSSRCIDPQPASHGHDKPCPECGGSGEIELFNSTVPCGKCAP